MVGQADFLGDIDREVLTMRLYRIFRLDDEDYITTVKLLYIYDSLAQEAGDEVFVVLTERLKDYKQRKKTEKLNRFYGQLRAQSLSRLAASPDAHAPGDNGNYIPGWKL